jgi:hypothetical protein
VSQASPQTTAAGQLARPSDVVQRPLDFSIIRRLIVCTRPYVRLRNWLLVLVVLRSLQLPLIAWITASVISGPIAARDRLGMALGVAGFLIWAAFTSGCFVFSRASRSSSVSTSCGICGTRSTRTCCACR